ncbi:MAG: alkaline phosphatase family protein [Chloroflexi bacterium]|nr:alkaline phosphatase family protein [Chloroflexota bacterium]
MNAAKHESANPARTAGRLRTILRMVLSFFITAALLFLIIRLFPGLGYIQGISTALLVILLLAAVQALLWPLLLRAVLALTYKISPAIMFISMPVLSVLLSAVFIETSNQLSADFQVYSFGAALLIALLLTVAQLVLSAVFAYDDEGIILRRTLRRIGAKAISKDDIGKPGIIFLEIDGLGEKVLRKAMAMGKMPTLKRWLDSGSHKLVGWDSDLSSQTMAAQAGILHGNNYGVVAFRWYVKGKNKVIDAAALKDVAQLEKQLSDGNGLMSHGGVTRASLFSGDASSVLITGSRVFEETSADLRSYYLNPSSFLRTLALLVWDWILEKRAAWGQALRKEEPRVKRGGVYFLIRSVVAVWLRDFSVFTLRGDLYAGVPYAYATLAGYDEVAHHSGIMRPDALEILRKLDREFRKLEMTAADAPRKYKFVVLSDHGQTQGATFRQRYGETLEEVVSRLLREGGNTLSVAVYRTKHEGVYHIDAAFKDYHISETAAGSQVYDTILQSGRENMEKDAAVDVVVAASGNFGMVYFPAFEQRASMEELEAKYPGLLSGLVEHPGIGFIVTRSKLRGPVALGKKGKLYLSTGEVEGQDILSDYAPLTLQQLARGDSFPDTPDVMVMSTYWKDADEAAAFEELVGSHGGAGGEQSRPFILYPSEFDIGTDKIAGAEAVYKILKGWTDKVRNS